MSESTTFPKYDRYKDSGVEWLGEVPEHWQVSKTRWIWKEVEDPSEKGEEQLLSISQYTGVTPTTADSRSESLVGYRRCKPNDLAMNIMLAWQGGLGVSDYEGIVSPAYSVFRLRSDNNAHFLGYLYRTKRYLDEFGRNSTGIVPSRWRLYPDKFGHVLTLLPSKPEQDRIVAFLDRKTAEIDTLIAKKQRQIELIDEQKAILITRAVTRGLNPNAKLKPSGIEWIGDIPEHWEVKRGRYLFSESNERSQDGSEVHLSMSQRFGLVPADSLSEKSLQSESYEGAKLCFVGDLVLNRLKAHLGVFSVAKQDGVISPDYSVFRLLNAENQPLFFELLFKTPNYIGQFNKVVRGIVVGFYRLYTGDFFGIPCFVPPPIEQIQVLEWIEKIAKQTQELKSVTLAHIDSLKTLRSTLIAHAVTGRIKV